MAELTTLHVEASENDADEQEGGTTSLTSTASFLNGATAGANLHNLGLRFVNVPIPGPAEKGSNAHGQGGAVGTGAAGGTAPGLGAFVILKAVLSLWVPVGTAHTKCEVTLACSAEDSAAAFTATSKDIATTHTWNKPEGSFNLTAKAGEYLVLSDTNVPNPGGDEPGLCESIGRALGRAGWKSGNALAIKVHAKEKCELEVENWDKEKATTHAAKLELEWTIAPRGSILVPQAVMRSASR